MTPDPFEFAVGVVGKRMVCSIDYSSFAMTPVADQYAGMAREPGGLDKDMGPKDCVVSEMRSFTIHITTCLSRTCCAVLAAMDPGASRSSADSR